MKLEDKYTSLELSKKLKRYDIHGKLKSLKCWYRPLQDKEEWYLIDYKKLPIGYLRNKDLENWWCYAYDILWDICVKYARQFFGEFFVDAGEDSCNSNVYHPIEILLLLQQNKKQEAEDYIWRNTIFNKKNKK